MIKSNTSRYLLLCMAIISILYIIGSMIYIICLIIHNNKLHKFSNCLDIDISNGMILEKDNNIWNNRYNVINPTSGYTELKCPTSLPVFYHIFNGTLVGYMKSNNNIPNYDIDIIDCNNKIKYIMRIGEFVIDSKFSFVSVDIRYNDKTMYYIKHNIYKSNDIDLYDNIDNIVANLYYTNNLWNISIYNNTNLVDYNILLSLVHYHQYYINGFTKDMCNEYAIVTIILLFCSCMLLCCYSTVKLSYIYNRKNIQDL